MEKKKNKFKAIDFFCGAGGMTTGFRKAGINVIAGIDIDKECKETYERNNKGSKFICTDIKNISFKEFEKQTGVTKNDNELIFIGCSPCQYFSKVKTDKKKSEKSKNLLTDFKKFVDEYNPGFIVIENVPGILTKEVSPLNDFLVFLKSKNYHHDKAIINAYKYGVPQIRRRFLLIASRVTDKVALPIANTKTKLLTVRKFIGDKNTFKPIPARHKDTTHFLHTTAGLSDSNLKRILITPHNGGTRAAWKDTDLQIPAYIGKDNSFQDIYGRMHWDKPAPTITTKFLSISNGRFAHPEQDRAISLREGATLQTFNKGYKFYGNSIGSIARHIGNAVPPVLSKKIALSIINTK